MGPRHKNLKSLKYQYVAKINLAPVYKHQRLTGRNYYCRNLEARRPAVCSRCCNTEVVVLAITIGRNIPSLGIQRRLGESSDALSRTLERLTSGMRINRSSDDAAGLAISQSLESNSRVFTQALRNISDGISAINIADGATDSLVQILTRQKELATQAASGSFSLLQRRALQAESDALTSEFNRITSSVDFNGLKIINGQTGDVAIQLGYGDNARVNISFGSQLSKDVLGEGFDRNSIGNLGYKIGTGDFDEDGKLDIIQKTNGTAYTVFAGNGNGTFKAGVSYSVPFTMSTDTNDSPPIVEDYNKDGNLDFILADTTNGKVYLFFGNGNGTFQSPVSYATTTASATDVYSADLNNDGYTDLVTSDSKSNGVASILIGNADGTFQAAKTLEGTGGSDYSVRLGDLNNDGNVDIVASFTGTMKVYLGNGSGNFQAGSTFSGTLGTLIDYDRDGFLDNAYMSGSALLVATGKGDGTFNAGRTMATGLGSSLVFSDMDGDGISDAITTSGSNLYVAHRNADGTTSSAVRYNPIPSGSGFQGLADFNSDGVADVLSYNLLSSTTTVSMAQTKKASVTPYLDLVTQAGARNALDILDVQMRKVSLERASLGAATSRLQTALNTLGATKTNIDAARGRIVDADVAVETANAVRLRTLQDATSAVLGQANLQPRLVLDLLSASGIRRR